MTRRRATGFTLLEMLVALAIMGMSLGLLYRASGGAVRNVGTVEHLQRAILVAQSVRELHDSVPQQGWNEAGRSAGYAWQVRSTPHDATTPGAAPAASLVRLHEIQILVTWDDAGRTREFELLTLLPQHRATGPGAVR
jgi:general secretion pathway protein I